ncbi:MAG: hypothetical protein JJ896_00215 [Rhodothermales bacterium]|nr:hypothetical protein [Rhodothermales bacterium]MBO6778050.1 hypothetical protein [Rhodothermales bacterium]
MRAFPLILALFLTPGTGDLEGTWFTGGLLGDEDSGSAKTHFYMWLEGDAAEALYTRLPVDAVEDDCVGDGTLTKMSGSVQCSLEPNGAHMCYLGIDLPEGRLVPGVIC